MHDLATILQLIFAKLVDAFSAKPELIVTSIGFFAGIVAFLIRSRKDLRLQHRNNYFSLELEASRIFTVAVQNPDIPRYLRGDFDGEEKSENESLKEQVFWFVSQELNIFEIAISLRNEKTITSELFSTWVAWFYELGTYNNFVEFWAKRPYDLMYNYKQDLQEVMTAAIELKMSPDFDAEDPKTMERFCEKVANIFGDPAILRQCRRTIRRNEILETRLSKAGVFPARAAFPSSQPSL